MNGQRLWFSCLLLATASAALASGGDSEPPDNVFAPTRQVEETARPAHAMGRVGVVMPSHARQDLFFAWRAAQGRALTEAQARAIWPAETTRPADLTAALRGWLAPLRLRPCQPLSDPRRSQWTIPTPLLAGKAKRA
jgi:hypothetical protein